MSDATVSEQAATNGGAPAQVQPPPVAPPPVEAPAVAEVPQIEAVQGEVLADGEGAKTRTLDWHGVNLVLPAELGASLMFSVTEAQLGDDTALLRAIRELIGDQWTACKQAAVEQHLPASAFHDLISAALEVYGLGAGEPSASSASSNGAGG